MHDTERELESTHIPSRMAHILCTSPNGLPELIAPPIEDGEDTSLEDGAPEETPQETGTSVGNGKALGADTKAGDEGEQIKNQPDEEEEKIEADLYGDH